MNIPRRAIRSKGEGKMQLLHSFLCKGATPEENQRSAVPGDFK